MIHHLCRSRIVSQSTAAASFLSRQIIGDTYRQSASLEPFILIRCYTERNNKKKWNCQLYEIMLSVRMRQIISEQKVHGENIADG